MKKQLYYLASPYSHSNIEIMKQRYEDAVDASVKLLNCGVFVYSPISHMHPIAQSKKLPTNWEWWDGYDAAFIEHCDGLIVLTLPGWDKSRGVQAEIDIAKLMKKGVFYLGLDDFNIPSIIAKIKRDLS